MKKRILLALAIGLFITMDSFAGNWIRRPARRPMPQNPPAIQNPRPGGTHNNVGAPLDGGILTILLGGAGVAYFAAKRKKNAAK